jgi:hypothetical protein
MTLAVSPAWSAAPEFSGTGAGRGELDLNVIPAQATAPPLPPLPPLPPTLPALPPTPTPTPAVPGAVARPVSPAPGVGASVAPAPATPAAPAIAPRPVAPAAPAPIAPSPIGNVPEPAVPTPGAAPVFNYTYNTAAAGALPPGTFGGPGGSLTDISAYQPTGIPQMIGDLNDITVRQTSGTPTIPQPFPPPPPPRPPSPRLATALVPSVRGLKIAENQSPRPQDRFFFSFNYYANVNGSLNERFGAPVNDIRVYRYILGFEKTFDNGNGSIGLRLPIDTLTANSTLVGKFKKFGGTSTSLGNLNIFAKYILKEDPKTGSLISAGFAISPTTGGNNFAGAPFIQNINTTLFQPFLGYLWIRGNFYLQGFSAFEFPVNQNQVTEMFNDIGMGYFLVRSSDPDRFLTGVAPTFEVHINTPLNHRGFDNPNEPAGTPDSVNLTYGLNIEFHRNSLLTLGFVTPVTGPRPFAYEALVLFNYRFGRSARRATPPVISG